MADTVIRIWEEFDGSWSYGIKDNIWDVHIYPDDPLPSREACDMETKSIMRRLNANARMVEAEEPQEVSPGMWKTCWNRATTSEDDQPFEVAS